MTNTRGVGVAAEIKYGGRHSERETLAAASAKTIERKWAELKARALSLSLSLARSRGERTRGRTETKRKVIGSLIECVAGRRARVRKRGENCVWRAADKWNVNADGERFAERRVKFIATPVGNVAAAAAVAIAIRSSRRETETYACREREREKGREGERIKRILR